MGSDAFTFNHKNLRGVVLVKNTHLQKKAATEWAPLLRGDGVVAVRGMVVVSIDRDQSDGWEVTVSRATSHDTLGEGSPVQRAAVDWEAYLQSIEPIGGASEASEPGPLPPRPRVSLLRRAHRGLSELLVAAPACYWLLLVALLHSAVGVSCGGLHLAALHVRPPSNPNAHVRKLAYT